MAMILQFPTARILRDPELRVMRARIGPLGADEAAGLHELDAGDRDYDVLREYLAADVGAATWKAWLRAYGRLTSQAISAQSRTVRSAQQFLRSLH